MLNLLKRLRKGYSLTYMLISHNFSIIDYHRVSGRRLR
jgi:ABC-type dipeptide/oligopeptide/nickel transport system ATPase subunit